MPSKRKNPGEEGEGEEAPKRNDHKQQDPQRQVVHRIQTDLIENFFSVPLENMLCVSGSGIEMERISPNLTHALIVKLGMQGCGILTTNVTDSFLLTINPPIKFVAVHATLLDVAKGRKDHAMHHRLREGVSSDSNYCIPPYFKENEWRGSICPVPITLEDDDVNMLEARAMAKSPTHLLVIGNSLNKATNAKGLNFLEDAKRIREVLIVNPDTNMNVDKWKAILVTWGMSPDIEVWLEQATAEDFTKRVIGACSESERKEIQGFIDPELIAERRKKIDYPPLDMIPEHKLAGRVSLKDLYEQMLQNVPKKA